MYCQVFFSQDGDVLEDVEGLLYEEGGFVTVESVREAVDYLSGWDYGAENEHEYNLAEEILEEGVQTYANHYFDEETGYTIVIQSGLYVSLWREAQTV